MRPIKWDLKQRQNLKFLLSEGYILKEIKEMMHLSNPTIVAELERGLSEEDFRARRYVKYDPMLSLKTHTVEIIGEDGLNALVRYENGEE